MASYKRFNGVTYVRVALLDDKKSALLRAKQIRAEGARARVYKIPPGKFPAGKYEIYYKRGR